MTLQFVKNLYQRLTEKEVTLVAVSKTKPVEKIQEVYRLGIREFGENRVQELVEKKEQLPDDIRWHMIGNLQKNKVKYIASFVELIHSVSSKGLLRTIDKEGRKNDRVINILLQLRIAMEDSKSGLEMNEATNLVSDIVQNTYPNVKLLGFMGMATFTDDRGQIKREFQNIKTYSDQVQLEYPDLFESKPILSYGMSGDYELAIAEGSNMVRIGSLIFGAR